jgi:hypothetical protein
MTLDKIRNYIESATTSAEAVSGVARANGSLLDSHTAPL